MIILKRFGFFLNLLQRLPVLISCIVIRLRQISVPQAAADYGRFLLMVRGFLHSLIFGVRNLSGKKNCLRRDRQIRSVPALFLTF